MSLVTGLISWYFSSWSNGDPHRSRTKVSGCSTFRIMCDVPSTAAFVVNLSNVFLTWLPKFSINVLLLFRCDHTLNFYMSRMSMYVVYFNFSASFCVTVLSPDIATPIRHVFSLSCF
jgi:hypothetical protein